MARTRTLTWRIALGAVLVVSILVLGACGGDEKPASEEQLTQVQLMLPRPPGITIPGHIVAESMGYYADEGLAVESLGTEGSTFVIQQLIAGNVRYGQADAVNTMIAVSKGADLRAFLTTSSNVFSIVTPEGSGIDSIEDLKGRALGITEPGGGEAPVVEAVLSDAGIKDDVELVPVGEGGPTVFRALKAGTIQAYAGAYNDFAAVEVAGVKLKPIVPAKYVDLPAGMLLVRQGVLDDEEGRDIAVRLARAWVKGTVFADENPEAALEIVCREAPADCESPEVARTLLTRVLDGSRPPQGRKWGELLLGQWQVAHDTLLASTIEESVDVETVATNDLIDEINDFDEEAVREQARGHSG